MQIGQRRSSHPATPCNWKVSLKLNRRILSPIISSAVQNWRGERLFAVATYLSRSPVDFVEGECLVVGRFELPNLAPGKYMLDIGFNETHDRFIDRIPNVAALSIAPSDYFGVTHPFSSDLGSVMVRSEWEAFNQESLASRSGIRRAIDL